MISRFVYQISSNILPSLYIFLDSVLSHLNKKDFTANHKIIIVKILITFALILYYIYRIIRLQESKTVIDNKITITIYIISLILLFYSYNLLDRNENKDPDDQITR